MTFDVVQTFDPASRPGATTLARAPRIALYQPDIPPNTGTILRLAACLGFAVDLIEPAGFRLDDKALIRAGLDYRERAALTRHADFDRFDTTRREAGRRLVLVETGARTRHVDFVFSATDTLLFGRESAGTPSSVIACADAIITIPMLPDRRSINLALACAIVVAEAYRQLDIFPVQ